MKTINTLLGTAVALGLAVAVSAQASAITFTYEGFITYNPPPSNSGPDVVGTFDSINDALAQNESDLGLPPGSIEEIGKQDVGGNWEDGLFGSDAIISFACGDAPGNDPCRSFTIDFEPTATNANGVALADWDLVKIAIKVGQTGGEDPGVLPGHGVWSVSDGEIDGTPITFDLSDYAPFLTDGFSRGVSNIHFFGVQTSGPSVPEPGTLGLLGVGVLALGIAVRRRRKQS